MHLRVAGLTIRATWAEGDLNLAPGRASARFLVEPSPPDVEIDVFARDLERVPEGECLFDSGGTWRLLRAGSDFLFCFFSSTLDGLPYKIARFTGDFSAGHVTLHRPFFASAESIDPLEYPLDELLYISLLGQGRGVEIHGCGVVLNGSDGLLFAGQSGAGKSTIARLCLAEPGAVVLSDDRVILREEPDGIWMYGTPWHGEEPLASPARARLAAIHFLRHHRQNEVAPASRTDSVARLFATCFPPFHDARAVDFTLGFLDRVASSVPCFLLGFRPDRTVLDAVRLDGSAR